MGIKDAYRFENLNTIKFHDKISEFLLISEFGKTTKG